MCFLGSHSAEMQLIDLLSLNNFGVAILGCLFSVDVLFQGKSGKNSLLCEQECLPYTRKCVCAAISGRLSDAFRFPLVCHVDGLKLTCSCVPITCTAWPCGNDLL